MKNSFKALVAATVLGLSGAASAVQVIDQNAPTDVITISTWYMKGLAQSFQQSANNISGAGFYIRTFSDGPNELTVSLWDSLPNGGGTQLATASSTRSEKSGGSWLDVKWDPVAIQAEKTYYLVFSASGLETYFAGDYTNTYTRGNSYANNYKSYPEFDYAFRTYAETTVTAVPEAQTYAMMLGGLGLLGAVARRRQPRA